MPRHFTFKDLQPVSLVFYTIAILMLLLFCHFDVASWLMDAPHMTLRWGPNLSPQLTKNKNSAQITFKRPFQLPLA